MSKADHDAPIFLFCSGMRCGSTLLQRMIISSGEAMIWGETGGALDHIKIAWDNYLQMLGPGGNRFPGGLGGNGELQRMQFESAQEGRAHLWIPCINPCRTTLEAAFAGFLEQLYEPTARRLGFRRWGIKKVRSDLATARFVRTLFPKSQFVFLVRDPIDCLTSIKQHDWMDHPDDPHALTFYTEQWRRTASSFVNADFGFSVRYEDLIADEGIRRKLFHYLGIADPESGFLERSRPKGRSNTDVSLTFFERRHVRKLTTNERKAYGYD